MNTISTGPAEGARIVSFRSYLESNPDKATSTDSAAVATLDDDFRCRVVGSGTEVETDMPANLGGVGTAPSPGWYLRAAAASCCATAIALRAAESGIALARLEVTATSTSDSRGMFGVGDARPGPLSFALHVSIDAPDAEAHAIASLVDYASTHAPVGDALQFATPIEIVLDLAD